MFDMIETKELSFFVACVETGSFRQAAEELYTAQSSVSKVIKGLEDKVGYPLFRRTNHGIEITDKGKVLYEKALDILKKIDDINQIE